MSQVKLIAFLDTLHFLARGGRVPQVAAWASSVLRIKPLVQIRPGASRASLIARVRTRRRAIEQLLTETGKQVDSRPLHVMVMHSDCAAEAEFVRYCLSQRFNCVEIMVGDFTPVMGIHTGPGLLGVAFYEEAS